MDAPARQDLGALLMAYLNKQGAEGTYNALRATNPYPPAPVADQARTVAHLASHVHGQLQHVDRHITAAQEADSPESVAFNLSHAARHTADGLDHSAHLLSAMGDYDPAVAAEIGALNHTGPATDDQEVMTEP